MRVVRLIVKGQPYSKANSRQLVTNRKTGRPMFIKSPEARKYIRDLEKQVRVLDRLLSGPLAVTMTIFYRTQLPDLDESLILDGLQGRIYINDRQVREKHIFHGIDAKDPRAEIEVREIPGPLFDTASF